MTICTEKLFLEREKEKKWEKMLMTVRPGESQDFNGGDGFDNQRSLMKNENFCLLPASCRELCKELSPESIRYY